MGKARLLGGLAILLALASSCATTITDVWRNPSYAGSPLHRVLVCAIARDDLSRRQIEDAFVSGIQSRGVQAIASYQVMPAGRPTAQEAVAVARRNGADGIVMTLPARVTAYPDYWPYGASGYGPWGPYAGWDYGWGGWGYPYAPAFWDTQVSLQAKAYAVEPPGQLLWAATTQTVDPSSIHSLLSHIVPRFIHSMAQAGVLPAQSAEGHGKQVSRAETPPAPAAG